MNIISAWGDKLKESVVTGGVSGIDLTPKESEKEKKKGKKKGRSAADQNTILSKSHKKFHLKSFLYLHHLSFLCVLRALHFVHNIYMYILHFGI